jgi:hypothetical protein
MTLSQSATSKVLDSQAHIESGGVIANVSVTQIRLRLAEIDECKAYYERRINTPPERLVNNPRPSEDAPA